MACVSSPTLTEYATLTTTSLSTSFIPSLTTLPPSVSTSLSVSCPTANGTCSTATILTTLPASVSTVQVPVTVDVNVVQASPTLTLYAPCSSTAPNEITTSVAIQSTPPPTVITSQISKTMQDGSVTIERVTITSSRPPTIVYVPTTIPTNQSGPSSQNRLNSIAPIAGGAIGGFFGLITIVGLIWLCLRRRQSWGDIFEGDHGYQPDMVRNASRNRRFDIDPDPEPKPYQYGLVGQVNSQQVHSPPASPTLAAQNAEIGMSMYNRYRVSPTPLVPSTAGQSVNSSRPSTASSAIQSRPGPSPIPQSRPSSATSAMPLRPPSGQDHHHPSFSSTSSRPALDEYANTRPMSSQSQHTHSQSGSWSRQSPPLAPVNWSAMASASPHPPADFGFGQDRTGTPVNLEEPRKLHIVNAPPSPTISERRSTLNEMSPIAGPSGKQMSTAVAKPVVVHQDAGMIEDKVPSSPPSYEE